MSSAGQTILGNTTPSQSTRTPRHLIMLFPTTLAHFADQMGMDLGELRRLNPQVDQRTARGVIYTGESVRYA
jgi:hypothetical protein